MYQRMQAYEQCQTAGGNMEGDENFLSYTGNVSTFFLSYQGILFSVMHIWIIQAKRYCHN